MRLVILALLLALAGSARAAPAWPVEAIAIAPGYVQVRVVAPASTAEVCAASGARVVCTPAAGGDTVALVLPARGGDLLTVWAGDRPYVVGGTLTVLALAQMPAPGGTAYLPVLEVTNGH